MRYVYMTSDTKNYLLKLLADMSPNGFAVGISFRGYAPIWAHSTYPTEWIDLYVAKSFLLQDPTILHCQSEIGHFLWSELGQIYPNNPVLAASRDYGMEEGNTLSLRINTHNVIASAAGKPWSKAEIEQARIAMFGLFAIHGETGTAPSNPPKISTKSLEVIRLMCDGYKDQAIGEELHITLPTVRQRRNAAMHQMDTKTHAQLVSQVIQNGWL